MAGKGGADDWSSTGTHARTHAHEDNEQACEDSCLLAGHHMLVPAKHNTIGTRSKQNYTVGKQQPYKFPMIGSNDSSTFLGIWHSSTLGVYSAFKNGPIISYDTE
jgi:hypothetical protein